MQLSCQMLGLAEDAKSSILNGPNLHGARARRPRCAIFHGAEGSGAPGVEIGTQKQRVHGAHEPAKPVSSTICLRFGRVSARSRDGKETAT